ncbi:MmgE/PrpD family protein [Parapusillimonas sp. SGNA-6]|nr:MmgE/PrpD family protein [Parapusillimonas sp. SGNA-6]
MKAITLALAEQAVRTRYDDLPDDIRRLVRQCIVDWFAVTLAGCADPVHRILADDVAEQGGNGNAGIVGKPGRYPVQQAALVNGATSHALDFDDVNLAISGHPTAVIFPALLALAQQRGSAGKDVVAAFVAGYEAACRVGVLVAPGHLAQGYHATGTVATFGSAVACAHLMGFDAQKMAAAMGVAGTQAAGLKAMFGSMVKPLHAGLAARNGLAAAMLVERGLEAPLDVLEHKMGFAVTHSRDFHPEAALDGPELGFHLRHNLFKYDASCFGTIATLDCIRQLVGEHGRSFRLDEVAAVTIQADRTVDVICNIQQPVSGTQAKFSIRQNAAYALAGIDTGKLETYDDAQVNAPGIAPWRDKIEILLQDGWPSMQARVTMQLQDGRQVSAVVDAGLPERDLDRQEQRIDEKFMRLLEPLANPAFSERLLARIRAFEHLDDVSDLTEYAVLGS